MSLQTVRSPFALSDYTPLPDHQEQTPNSFYDAKPVLYYHATGAKAWIPKSQRGKLPFFPVDLSSGPTSPENNALNGQAEENVEQKVDLFVNSRYDHRLPKAANPSILTLHLPETSPSSAPPPSAVSQFPTNRLAFMQSKPSVPARATKRSLQSTYNLNLPRAAPVTTSSKRLNSP
jgi:hypothetical protein